MILISLEQAAFTAILILLVASSLSVICCKGFSFSSNTVLRPTDTRASEFLSSSKCSSPTLLRMIPQSQSQTAQQPSSTATTIVDVGSRLLPKSAFDTIQEGKIAVVPNFLNDADILPLRNDAQHLWSTNRFSTDALAGYGTKGKFDPTKDRAVLKLKQWKDPTLGDYKLRADKFGALMGKVRNELAINLNRPDLALGDAVHKYGIGSTEISYTRFGTGAYLKRHVDEHHEELKGVDGWSKTTRRSISWLIYLNEPDWNPITDCGQLRCYERRQRPIGRIGATINGDLQIGWLSSAASEAGIGETPVYLDAKNHDHGECAMYFMTDDDTNNDMLQIRGRTRRIYITKPFKTNPIFYVAGSESLVKKLLIESSDVAKRFRFIEPPKSKLDDFMKNKNNNNNNGNILLREEEELIDDIDPYGGTLVLFDSVSLPHEVLPTRNNKERWACSGWFHEDQQGICTTGISSGNNCVA